MQVQKHYLRILFLIFLFLLASPGVNAQNNYQEFLEDNDIDKKSEKALYLWNEYLRGDLDSLKILSVEMLLSAADAKSAFGRAVGYKCLGSYQIRTGEIESGLSHMLDSRTYFEQKEDAQMLSEINNDIGNAYYLAGKYSEAIKAYLASLEYGKSSPDKTDKFNAKSGLGKAYCAIGDTSVGMYTMSEYKNESIKIAKYESAADAYAYLGQIEMERGYISLAKEFYRKSILFSKKSDSKIHLSHALNNQAILKFNLNELDSSLFYFEESLRLREQLNNAKGIIESYYNLGFFYGATGDFHNAYLNYSRSVDLARENKFVGDELDALNELIAICSELGYTEEQENYEQIAQQLTDRIERKNDTDKEIVAYAEKIIEEVEIVDKVADHAKTSSYFIWILIGGTFFLVIIAFTRKKKKR